MTKITEGVLIFNNWFEAAKLLSGSEFKKLMLAIYEYQIFGKQPPTFTPKGEAVARSILPLIEKRVKGAMWARQGLEKNEGTPKGVPMGVTPDEPAREPMREPARVNRSTPYPKEYKRKENIRNSSEEEDRSWAEYYEDAAERFMKLGVPADEPPAPDKKD